MLVIICDKDHFLTSGMSSNHHIHRPYNIAFRTKKRPDISIMFSRLFVPIHNTYMSNKIINYWSVYFF